MVTQNYVNEHVEIGIASLRMIIDEENRKTLEVRLVILFTGHTLVTLTLYGKTKTTCDDILKELRAKQYRPSTISWARNRIT